MGLCAHMEQNRLLTLLALPFIGDCGGIQDKEMLFSFN